LLLKGMEKLKPQPRVSGARLFIWAVNLIGKSRTQ